MSALPTLHAAEQIRFWSLSVLLRTYQAQLRYVDYPQAEQDAAQLAATLLTHHTRAEIARWHFRPIPRGGLIVLGLLAYQLDLAAGQLEAGPDNETTLCLVDDCSLTGMRFHQQLQKTDARRVVFAHLYSTPALRAAICAGEPRVAGCYSARDLRELTQPADERDSAPIEAHLGQYAQRYSHAPVEPLAFPWNEPTTQIQDPFTNEVDERWHFVPPGRVLAHLRLLDLPPRPVSAREWRVPDDVVWAWNDGVLWLLATTDAQVYRLDGFAADAWRALAGYGTLAAARSFVADLLPGRPAEAIAAQLSAQCRAFVAHGVLAAV